MTVAGSETPAPGETNPPNLKWAFAAVIGALLGGGLIFMILIAAGQLELGALGSVVLLVAGFVTVTLLMLVASIVLAALGMRAPGSAFGMPEGSIRALIAMVLILIFAIIGVVVFNAGSPDQEYTSTGLTQAQVDQLRTGNAVVVQQTLQTPAASPEPLYTVVIRPGMTPDSHDFGLQLMTTVSTLVVAVAGFYFGSKATGQAIRAAKEFQPPPRPGPAITGTQQETDLDATGEGDADADEDEDADGPTDGDGEGEGDGDGDGEGADGGEADGDGEEADGGDEANDDGGEEADDDGPAEGGDDDK